MKLFLLLILVSFSALAADCVVDGISDSPQKFHCYINNAKKIQKLDLICQDGNYELHWAGKMLPVTVAYHEEVEEGSSPLVFVSEGMTLTTVSYQIYNRASVVVDGKNLDGLCFDH